jgi:hypothetical protein
MSMPAPSDGANAFFTTAESFDKPQADKLSGPPTKPRQETAGSANRIYANFVAKARRPAPHQPICAIILK